MSKKLDVLHEWLGIPPAEQPPNHYRLLGLPKYESDPQAIELAIAKLKTVLQEQAKQGHIEEAKKLYEEIKRAKNILLHVERKEIYDRLLTKESRKKFVAPSRSDSNLPEGFKSKRLQSTIDKANPSQTDTESSSQNLAPRRQPPKFSSRFVLVCVVLMVVSTIVGSIGILKFGRHDQQASASEPESREQSRQDGIREMGSAANAEVNLKTPPPVSPDPKPAAKSERAVVATPSVPDDMIENEKLGPTPITPPQTVPDDSGGMPPSAHQHWEDMIGLSSTLVGRVQKSHVSRSGKTRYLFFSSDPDDAMVYLDTRKASEKLTQEFLQSLEGNTVRVTGKVKREFGTRRIGVAIQAENQIEILD